MNLQLGVYSFGNTPRTDDGSYGPTAQAIRNVLEAVYLAEEVGLDFFGFGEHHTRSMPLSSPTALVNASRPHGVTVDGVSTSEIFVAHPRKGVPVSAEENTRLVQTAYEAFGRGDMAAFAEVMADDIEWEARPIPELSRHRSGGCCPPRGVAPRGEPADRRVQHFCRNSRSQVWQQRMMVRRGSTVRVRQRASAYPLLTSRFCCLDGRGAALSTSTERPPTSTASRIGSSDGALSVSSSRIACSRPSRARWP
jgi:hypothetical protein